ncbi:FGGY-family carbohydrate kinase [Corynebacterium flavescens]|uniref:Sugar kinase n=1 Tax=Corynebacterium flavescens TaxID=28028 RepID=A0AB73BAW5_CORFL|nr:FGGY-family carbohydrate kinase [Corynebacterium flavescens]KAA8720949.1 xylulose kinase [Corynebacterium flavescens]GEB98871.1 sugar kinase [Corynebacterium flavescens]
MASLTLALDFGTSGLKGALFFGSTIVDSAQTPYPTRNHTQRPQDWLEALRQVAAALPGYEAVSITGQMQDLICLDSGGDVLGAARLYSDTSATSAAARLHALVPDWEQITGNEQGATSNAAMFAESHPERTAHLLFGPSGFIAHALGLGYHVDSTTASTTGLLDLDRRAWSEKVAHAAGIDMALLPMLSDGLLGTVAPNDYGITPGVSFFLAPGDAATTTLGIIGDEPGRGYIYLGTSGWYAEICEERPQWPGAFHVLALPGGTTLAIAALLSAAGTADWARVAFLGGASHDAAEELLATRPRGWSGISSIPSLHGERFPVRADAAGVALAGLRSTHAPADMYKAVLEGVALFLSHAMSRDATASAAALPVVGGGANSQLWLQILADVTGRTIVAPTLVDASLLGAAGVLAEGQSRIIEPDPRAVASYATARASQLRLFSAVADSTPGL